MTSSVPYVGSLWTLVGRFFSDAAQTIPADPDDVTLTIRSPLGAEITPTPTSSATGVWTYDWAPAMGGDHEILWEGTGAVQAVTPEVISVFGWPRGASIGPIYITREQLKATLEMSGTTFADADIELATGAASRAVDSFTGRRFWLDADANQERYYTPRSRRILQIDDLVEMTSVQVDTSGNGNFDQSWTLGTDYVLEPANAPSEIPARPYETLRVRKASGWWWPCSEQAVKVTGQFGWASVPDDVAAATGILAAKLLRRTREAPFGIVMAGIDAGVAMRITRTDPDVYTLLQDYVRREPFA